MGRQPPSLSIELFDVMAVSTPNAFAAPLTIFDAKVLTELLFERRVVFLLLCLPLAILGRVGVLGPPVLVSLFLFGNDCILALDSFSILGQNGLSLLFGHLRNVCQVQGTEHSLTFVPVTVPFSFAAFGVSFRGLPFGLSSF